MPTTVDDLRSFAVARSLFPATTLKRALDRLGFVQADPIRAPARAQDLMLRHRVKGYRAGDLERRYCKLGIEEDVFINYGFVTRSLQALMHPRSESSVPAGDGKAWPAERRKRAQLLLDFVSERGAVHPREVDDHFSHGSVKNYWGGSSNATTHLLDAMHYRGMLRVARREGGIRIYTIHQHGPEPADAEARRERMDMLVDTSGEYLRAASGREPVVPVAPVTLCRAAVAERGNGRHTAGERTAIACSHRWHRMVLAAEWECGAPGAAGHRSSARTL